MAVDEDTFFAGRRQVTERAVPVSLEGRSILIASRDDLIAIKRQRGRDYDLTDIALLEGTGAE